MPDAIVIERSDLPEVHVAEDGSLKVTYDLPDWPGGRTFNDRWSTRWLSEVRSAANARAKALAMLAVAEYLEANPDAMEVAP